METPKTIRIIFKNVKRILKVAWRTDKAMFLILLLMVAIGASFPIALSYLFRLVLDRIVETANTLQIVSISLLSLFAFRYIIDFIVDLKSIYHYDYIENVFWKKFEDVLTLDFLKKISRLDIPYFENSETQNLIQKAKQSYPWRHNNFIFSILYGATSFGTFIGALVTLIPFGVWIPFVMVAATLPRFYFKNKYIKIEWAIYNQKIIEAKELSYLRMLLEDPSSVKELKVAQAENSLLNRVKNLQGRIFESFKGPLKKYLPSFYGAIFIEAAVLFILAYFKLPLVVKSAITIGAFTFYIQMLDRISQSVQEIVNQFSRLNEQNLFVGDYFDVLELPKKIIEKVPGLEFKEIAPPVIEFKDISFRYDEAGPEVLKNISFSLKPGEHLAIVGPNGAGKTTLIRLLLRFYDPQKGQVLINGVDLKDLKLSNWYKFISILFQDFARFMLSVKDNILMGNTEVVDEEKMKEAARKSGAAEFIEKLPNRYEQRLGKRFEDSAELSQGQWQRLVLARAFYEAAPILILDEPTSAIDIEAEAEIFENLDELYQDKTLILISHRFSTVRKADKIIVLKDGQIVEEGNHNSLMKKSGIYARMFRKQAEGYIE
jgi:ABC-type multidrug transport system fused ATPase/permease subunit